MSLATPDMIQRLQEALGTKAKQAPTYRCYLLYDKVYRADILAHAYALARQREGAPGMDGETFEAIEAAGRERWLAAVQRPCGRSPTARSPCDGGGFRNPPAGNDHSGFRRFGTAWSRRPSC